MEGLVDEKVTRRAAEIHEPFLKCIGGEKEGDLGWICSRDFLRRDVQKTDVYCGAFTATTPRLAMLSPFFSEGTALT